MRIAGGSLGGRQFEAPKGHKTHPMSEQIRNALFNALGDVRDLTVLDAYAGSGAVAFEAISRGAAKVYATEKDVRAFKVLKANRDNLGLQGQVEVSRANCASWAENKNRSFDVIIADPPYDNISASQLNSLVKFVTKTSGIFVLSCGIDRKPAIEGLTEISSNKFGNANLSFFKK